VLWREEVRVGHDTWWHVCAACLEDFLLCGAVDMRIGRDSPSESLAGFLLVVMTTLTASEGVVLPVGGVILEPISSARFSPGESPVHLLDERRRRLWRHYLLEGVIGGDTSWLGGGKPSGGLAGQFGAGGELEGGCLALAAATKIILAARDGHKDVGSCYLQRTAAVDIAWQLLVRRGTASQGGACGTIIVGRLGLQRTAAGYSLWSVTPVWYIVKR